MVRLKAGGGGSEIEWYNIFQFQYGAIKGQHSSQVTTDIILFQFQYGAIKGATITLNML